MQRELSFLLPAPRPHPPEPPLAPWPLMPPFLPCWRAAEGMAMVWLCSRPCCLRPCCSLSCCSLCWVVGGGAAAAVAWPSDRRHRNRRVQGTGYRPSDRRHRNRRWTRWRRWMTPPLPRRSLPARRLLHLLHLLHVLHLLLCVLPRPHLCLPLHVVAHYSSSPPRSCSRRHSALWPLD